MIRLERVRKDKGLSQLDVWHASKVSPGDISRVERGWLKLSDERKARVAEALDWQGDPAELFEEVK